MTHDTPSAYVTIKPQFINLYEHIFKTFNFSLSLFPFAFSIISVILILIKTQILDQRLIHSFLIF